MADNLVARHRWLSLRTGLYDEPYVMSSPGVQIVPVNAAGEVLFIVEPTVPTGELVLTIPGGGVDGDEDHQIAANRELQEEIGFKAQRLDYLGVLNPETRHTVWPVHLYLGRDLVESHLQGDEEHAIQIEALPLATFPTLMKSRRLNDAIIIAALYMARDLIQQETL